MTCSTRRCVPAIVAAVLATGTTFAQAAEPGTPDIQAQIQQLQVQLEELKVQQAAQAEAARVDATVDQVLNEADRRSQMMQVEGFTAGWNKGKFLLQSADGAYSMSPGLQFQFRYIANSAEDAAGDDDVENGFEVRRMKVSFEGNAFTKDLKYVFVWGTNSGGSLILEDAYINYKLNDTMSLQLGQFKDPTFHEESVSSKRQLAVDRSMLNEVLGGGVSDRVQGIGLTWKPTEQFSLQGVFSDGINTDNTTFLDAGGNAGVGVAAPDYGVSVRAEYLVFGNKSDYGSFTTLSNKEDLLVIGGGANYTEAGDSYVILHTVDAQYEIGKLALYGAFVGSYRSTGDAAGDDSFYDWGALAQAAYMVSDKLEVFGRYDVIFLDEDALAAGDEDTLHEATIGLNYYLQGHNAKITVDGTYLPNGAPGIGGLGFVGSDDDQFVLRGQFQLLL